MLFFKERWYGAGRCREVTLARLKLVLKVFELVASIHLCQIVK
jgi:hypothetical protein